MNIVTSRNSVYLPRSLPQTDEISVDDVGGVFLVSTTSIHVNDHYKINAIGQKEEARSSEGNIVLKFAFEFRTRKNFCFEIRLPKNSLTILIDFWNALKGKNYLGTKCPAQKCLQKRSGIH